MGAALAQILRSLAHVCEDAEWHSKCCTEEVGCTCDAIARKNAKRQP